MASEPDFWNDPEKSQKILQEAGALKNKLSDYERVIQSYEDACTLLEMATEEEDESLLPELDKELQDFKQSYENYRLKALLCEEFDGKNAIVTLHAGAGGTEACDWTSMLYRMYSRWAEKNGYKVDVLDYQEGDRVRHKLFGDGVVNSIVDRKKDYEVTVCFDKAGVKKMFANFAKLEKIESSEI